MAAKNSTGILLKVIVPIIAVIILSLISIIYANVNGDIDSNAVGIREVRGEVQKVADTVTQVQVDLAEMKGNIKYLIRLATLNLDAQGVPQTMIDDAKNGDSVRDTTL